MTQDFTWKSQVSGKALLMYTNFTWVVLSPFLWSIAHFSSTCCNNYSHFNIYAGLIFSLSISICEVMAQMVKNLPAMRETRVWSLDREDPLEKGMATHSSILAWRIPWIEGYRPWGRKESDTTEWLTWEVTSILPSLQVPVKRILSRHTGSFRL